MLKQKCNKTQSSLTFKLADVEHEEDEDDNDGIFLEEGRVIEKKNPTKRAKRENKEEGRNIHEIFFSHCKCMFI